MVMKIYVIRGVDPENGERFKVTLGALSERDALLRYKKRNPNKAEWSLSVTPAKCEGCDIYEAHSVPYGAKFRTVYKSGINNSFDCNEYAAIPRVLTRLDFLMLFRSFLCVDEKGDKYQTYARSWCVLEDERKGEKKMNIANELDLAIKRSEGHEGYTGYQVGKREYLGYMSNCEWDDFLLGMPERAKKEFGEGSGRELKEVGHRPPKMACYGSSSRLIYMLSSHKENFYFEEKLPTTVGGKAHLDGFMKEDGRYVFVEAKCREPYSAKYKKVSDAYRDLYGYISRNMAGLIDIECSESDSEGDMSVSFFCEGEKIEHFDLKQMICHLLGIATGVLSGKYDNRQIDFIYLLYDPTDLEIEGNAGERIAKIYARECYECASVDFATLFGTVLRYLRDERNVGYMSEDDVDALCLRFTFSLCSQELYPDLIG